MLWGTDSIWYGSPQDQIDAFRAFQISPSCARSTATPSSRRRSSARCSAATRVKVYSLDEAALKKHLVGATRSIGARAAYAGAEDPLFATYGPKTREEWLDLG